MSFLKRYWVHGQTLDERGRRWKHGRASIRSHATRKHLHVYWNFGVNADFTLAFRVRHFDDLWSFTFELPYLWYLSIGYAGDHCWFDREREISLAWRAKGTWWHWRIWTPVDSWSASTPRWRDGSWHPLDTLLGKEQYSEVSGENGSGSIAMPEGLYSFHYTSNLWTRKRPRWFRARQGTRYEIVFPRGIPEPGKGENSWDMDDTATMEVSLTASDLKAGLDRIKRGVLDRRERYGGRGWVPRMEQVPQD